MVLQLGKVLLQVDQLEAEDLGEELRSLLDILREQYGVLESRLGQHTSEAH